MAVALRVPLIALCALYAGAMLGGCAARPPPRPPPTSPAAEHQTLPPTDDWRALTIAPFGSPLQQLHVPVHEVLLFRDREDADDAARPADQECFALDAPARRFLGREVASYLLCFASGRLERIEVTVNLPAEGAAADFARYCDDWLQGTVASEPRTAVHCSGAQQPGQSFSASLGESADADGFTVPLSISIAATSHPESP